MAASRASTYTTGNDRSVARPGQTLGIARRPPVLRIRALARGPSLATGRPASPVASPRHSVGEGGEASVQSCGGGPLGALPPETGCHGCYRPRRSHGTTAPALRSAAPRSSRPRCARRRGRRGRLGHRPTVRRRRRHSTDRLGHRHPRRDTSQRRRRRHLAPGSRPSSGRVRDDGPRDRGADRRVHRHDPAARRDRRPRARPRRVDQGERRQLPADVPPARRGLRRDARQGRRLVPGHDPAQPDDALRPGRAAARVPGAQGARPVRHQPARPRAAPGRQALLRRAEHPRPRDDAAGAGGGLPQVDRAPRGDPRPRVRGQPVGARLPERPA